MRIFCSLLLFFLCIGCANSSAGKFSVRKGSSCEQLQTLTNTSEQTRIFTVLLVRDGARDRDIITQDSIRLQPGASVGVGCKDYLDNGFEYVIEEERIVNP
jgi:hypothetical protein